MIVYINARVFVRKSRFMITDSWDIRIYEDSNISIIFTGKNLIFLKSGRRLEIIGLNDNNKKLKNALLMLVQDNFREKFFRYTEKNSVW